MDIHLQDIPFLAFIIAGILLPELYAKVHWSFRVLSFVRLVTLVASCVLAVTVNRIMYPHADPGVMFARAFSFVAFSRIILIASHLQADRNVQQHASAEEK